MEESEVLKPLSDDRFTWLAVRCWVDVCRSSSRGVGRNSLGCFAGVRAARVADVLRLQDPLGRFPVSQISRLASDKTTDHSDFSTRPCALLLFRSRRIRAKQGSSGQRTRDDREG